MRPKDRKYGNHTLDELLELDGKRTPGEWETTEVDIGEELQPNIVLERDDRGRVLRDTWHMTMADCLSTVAAVNALRPLVDRVRELEAFVERVSGGLELIAIRDGQSHVPLRDEARALLRAEGERR